MTRFVVQIEQLAQPTEKYPTSNGYRAKLTSTNTTSPNEAEKQDDARRRKTTQDDARRRKVVFKR